jgi:hypothetical protein
MCKLGKKFLKYGKIFHSVKITILKERKALKASHNIIASFRKILCSKSLCTIYFKIYYHLPLDPSEAEFCGRNLTPKFT